MRLKDHYDWVVLGDHPGALISACLVSRLGFSVLVLPMAPGLQSTISKSGQCLDPEPNFLMGMGGVEQKEGLLGGVLNRLGVPITRLSMVERGDAWLPQIVTPDSRLQMRANDTRFFHELKRELGEETATSSGLIKALDQLEPLALRFWRGYPEKTLTPNKRGAPRKSLALDRDVVTAARKAVSQMSTGRTRVKYWNSPSSHLSSLLNRLADSCFAEVMLGMGFGVTGIEQEDPHLLDLVSLIGLGRTGASFRGGMKAYRQFLLALTKSLGAQVSQGTRCRRVFIEASGLIGVQVASHGKVISVHGGILGCSLSHAREFLYFSDKKLRKRFRSPPRPDGWRFTIALTVNREAIPPGMNQRVIWKEPKGPSLEIEVADPESYGLSKSNHRLIFVRSVMPFTQDSLDVKYQRLVAARMYKQLLEVFPYLEKHVVRVFPEFRTKVREEDDEFSEIYGFVSPDLIPDNLRCIRGRGIGSFSGINGLFVASSESYPSLGGFGGTVAAVEATTHFAQNAGIVAHLTATRHDRPDEATP